MDKLRGGIVALWLTIIRDAPAPRAYWNSGTLTCKQKKKGTIKYLLILYNFTFLDISYTFITLFLIVSVNPIINDGQNVQLLRINSYFDDLSWFET